MKILIILGCIICFVSVIKSTLGLIDDIDTNKARKELHKMLKGEKENDENGRNE